MAYRRPQFSGSPKQYGYMMALVREAGYDSPEEAVQKLWGYSSSKVDKKIASGAVTAGAVIDRLLGNKKTAPAPKPASPEPAPTTELIGLVAGGARHASGNNRKPGYCEDCGEFLPVGKGRLDYCVEDSGCLQHHDESGYHLEKAKRARAVAEGYMGNGS